MNGAVVLDGAAFGIGHGRWSTNDEDDVSVTVTIAFATHRSRRPGPATPHGRWRRASW
ncbi:MAG TPA: hypothetical protein VE309_01800 [Caulobacteraceae bacterium]|nr:hypothetical protein [Caulobacteraceae bacterium]